MIRKFLIALLFALALPISAQAASRFWVGGTGTWDASDTTHWAASSGGAGGQSVPGSSDTVTFDGSSGGGTVTVNTPVSISSLTTSAFTGTLDFSANNNDVTLSSSNGFIDAATGVHTLNLGNGTWTLSGQSALWNVTASANLTLNANSSTIAFTNTTPNATRNFTPGGKTYNAVTVAAQTTGLSFNITAAGTFTTLTVTAPGVITFPFGVTTTVTTFNALGSVSSPVSIQSASASTAATVAVTTANLSGAAFKLLTFTGSPIATESLNLGGNSGIMITGPGGNPGFIGGGI